MRKILSCKVGDLLIVENKLYTITKKEEYLLNDTKAFRFTLFSEDENIILEIKKEFALNYQIFKYSFLESVNYDSNFISILGTTKLGYNNPSLSKYNIYKKVKIKKEKYEIFKHIIPEDELPQDYQEKGYYKDEYGNYYFLTKRYLPQVKKLSLEERLCWEYKQDNNIRLLIETKKHDNSKIYIYKGKELIPSQIDLANAENIQNLQKSTDKKSSFFLTL